MQTDTQTNHVSKKLIWTGRVISALPVMFLLMDGIMKLVKPAIVVETTVRLGYRENAILGIGILLEDRGLDLLLRARRLHRQHARNHSHHVHTQRSPKREGTVISAG